MSISTTYDLIIIGGGINGAGIARDAAGRGLKVLLCEKDDLAGATSSASTKLIHGGLRYLEYYEFRLVREALGEREVLLRAAPHLIRPLRFVMPHVASLRPAWMIRAGLFLYDRLAGGMTLPRSGGINLREHKAGGPLKQDFRKGFIYSDCRVDDSRLVVLNCLGAAEHGTKILPRCCCVRADRDGDEWNVILRHGDSSEITERTRMLVNAAGPWAGSILGDQIKGVETERLRLVKGGHMVVPRMFDHGHAYIFQNTDKRIVFAIPYFDDFTMIGTTDQDYTGNPDDAALDEDEAQYLCDAVNRYFDKQITPDDAVWTFSGVRPLYGPESKDASTVSRDYVLEMDGDKGVAPLLNVFSGKITTYRKLAEHALGMMGDWFSNMGPAWTADALLPGGNLPDGNYEGFISVLMKRYSFLPVKTLRRMAHAYGTRIDLVLENATSLDDLGQCFGQQLYESEVRYLMKHEWARSVDDIVWRRSKLGLDMTADDLDVLELALSSALRKL